MSKVILKCKEFKTMDELTKACKMKTDKTRSTIAVGGSDTVKDLVFELKDCLVRFKPEKYDKLVISVPDPAIMELEKLKGIMFPDTEPFIRGSSMNLKVSPKQKEEINKKFSIGDWVQVLIKFTAVWTINGRHYASFELLEIKKASICAFD